MLIDQCNEMLLVDQCNEMRGARVTSDHAEADEGMKLSSPPNKVCHLRRTEYRVCTQRRIDMLQIYLGCTFIPFAASQALPTTSTIGARVRRALDEPHRQRRLWAVERKHPAPTYTESASDDLSYIWLSSGQRIEYHLSGGY